MPARQSHQTHSGRCNGKRRLWGNLRSNSCTSQAIPCSLLEARCRCFSAPSRPSSFGIVPGTDIDRKDFVKTKRTRVRMYQSIWFGAIIHRHHTNETSDEEEYTTEALGGRGGVERGAHTLTPRHYPVSCPPLSQSCLRQQTPRSIKSPRRFRNKSFAACPVVSQSRVPGSGSCNLYGRVATLLSSTYLDRCSFISPSKPRTMARLCCLATTTLDGRTSYRGSAAHRKGTLSVNASQFLLDRKNDRGRLRIFQMNTNPTDLTKI